MVAELSPVLSDALPGLPRRAKLGNRHLFSAVPFEALADFRSAVAVLAEPAGDGRLIAWAAAFIDSAGVLCPADGGWPDRAPAGASVLVHFLVDSDGERQALLDRLFAPAAALPLSLAA